MKRVVVGLALAALLGLAIWRPWAREESRPPPAGDAPSAGTEAPRVTVRDGLTIIGGTGFDLHYRARDRTAVDDLREISGLLDAAILLVKDIDRIPLPDNVDFTAFLQGKNPHRVAWIRPGHPAVSPRGELLDRWETPVFFHQESSRRISVRSAGPDRRMGTEDDAAWPNEE
jgi:hypothetical protein